MDKIVIASRESLLAMWQAKHIQARLRALSPATEVEILGMTTKGDQILDKTLSKIGGKGLFVKELEVALMEGRADLAVHSIKDVPMELPEGFELAAICQREDPRDAFVSNRYPDLGALPAGAVVGTSSLRREAQLRARFPHLTVRPLRGNVQTRLAKLDNGDYDAIILAAAGLKRLGQAARIASLIEPQASLPAAGQGALGIEIRAGRPELAALLAPLSHAETHACVTAERALSRALGGSCQLPLGAHATLEGDMLRLTGLLARPDGTKVLRARAEAPAHYAEALGRAVARLLIDQGAEALIASILGES